MPNFFAPYDPDLQAFAPLDPPSWGHPAGTDRFGRDLFSRILVGLRTSVFSTLVLVAAVTTIGTAAGVLCGYRGGMLDAVLMRVSDVVLAFPGLVFALAVAAVLGGGLQNAVLALAFIGWPKYARIARSLTLAVRGSSLRRRGQTCGFERRADPDAPRSPQRPRGPSS